MFNAIKGDLRAGTLSGAAHPRALGPAALGYPAGHFPAATACPRAGGAVSLLPVSTHSPSGTEGCPTCDVRGPLDPEPVSLPELKDGVLGPRASRCGCPSLTTGLSWGDCVPSAGRHGSTRHWKLAAFSCLMKFKHFFRFSVSGSESNNV